MALYRSKPVTVEAQQFFPDKPIPFNDIGPVVANDGRDWYVTTIHGQKTLIAPGDFIILEDASSPDASPFAAYPCKPDIFKKKYELTSRAME